MRETTSGKIIASLNSKIISIPKFLDPNKRQIGIEEAGKKVKK